MPESGCWIWIGSRQPWRGPAQGYGQAYVPGSKPPTTVVAHRAVYQALRGPIPDGLVLDHKCRTRPCVNPDHMDVVTMSENLKRGEGFIGVQSRRTHCPQGHELSDDNVVGYLTHRQCRECANARSRERWRRLFSTDPTWRERYLAYQAAWKRADRAKRRAARG